jgi:hypothetical protein
VVPASALGHVREAAPSLASMSPYEGRVHMGKYGKCSMVYRSGCAFFMKAESHNIFNFSYCSSALFGM